jgi:methanogenic corrinoid protein MtbC1
MENIDNPSNSDLTDFLPIYNIKAVSSMLDLLPVTLRAWERRYGLPSPQRGDQGYRLYSEYDVRTLRWLKHQSDSGMSIGQAVKYLNELRDQGNDPAKRTPAEPDSDIAISEPVSLAHLADQFYKSLIHYNDQSASEVLRTAFSLYNVDQVLNQIVESTLVEIGESWHRGEIPIAVEHFATQFCIQHLMSMLNASVQPSREGVIFAACAPGEMHQVGLLSLVVMLRWRGWDVKYFGQDMALDRILETLKEIRPDAILFSATMTSTGKLLIPINEILNDYPYEKPLCIYGGNAFRDPKLAQKIQGEIIDQSPTRAIDQIERLIYQRALKL